MLTVTRYHDISCGHRVHGHEGKCAHLHGHNYRIHFTCETAEVDALGRVIDFGAIKLRLCEWLERHWDHRFLISSRDPWSGSLGLMDESVVKLPFNPTAENMAHHLVTVVGPEVLAGTGVRLVGVTVEETRKCSATFTL
ncbi:6-pyruvoyl trahydropterin synthase family protein [Paraburkholderia sp. HD33-4]|uniref:6-pyruvoyl trahydropterin synthase family protein n=1 Tax=Paraburkholderia sp. HD33-4 TaxID=2883242 RepID=UPI001F1C6126|nr:6-carboxytetrahydropterin synthase [Paraburkholderia sp. HD33-4]